MTSPYDGVQWVGMDLYRRRPVLVRRAHDGQWLGRTVRFDNDPARLKREIAKAGPQPKAVLEATLGWYWAADALAETGAEVHLAHPLRVKGVAHRRVRNEGDAADPADLLRLGRLPKAWPGPGVPRPAARTGARNAGPRRGTDGRCDRLAVGQGGRRRRNGQPRLRRRQAHQRPQAARPGRHARPAAGREGHRRVHR